MCMYLHIKKRHFPWYFHTLTLTGAKLQGQGYEGGAKAGAEARAGWPQVGKDGHPPCFNGYLYVYIYIHTY